MITDSETLKMKVVILNQTEKIFKKLLQEDAISDKEADQIIEFVSKKIVPQYSARPFRRSIQEFCEKFPKFQAVEDKLELMRSELIQKIGQECIDQLMDQDAEKWAKLSEKIESMNENTIQNWVKLLPKKQWGLFMSALQ